MHFDISHNALPWQRRRHNNMIHLRIPDSNKQAGPLCKRPGYKEATRALMNLQYAEGQGVPKIPVKSRTRQNNTLDPELQKFLEWSSFHWAEYFAEPQKFRTPTTIIIFKLVTKLNMVEFVILGPKLARMALSGVARQRVAGQR